MQILIYTQVVVKPASLIHRNRDSLLIEENEEVMPCLDLIDTKFS